MVKNLVFIETDGVDPYENLAVEEYLLFHCQKDQIILYLWRNQNTVVIGRNQNAWRECRISELENSGGHLARRLSGGGAVYHDLGNLNFTFLARKDDYDLDRQMKVILSALQKLDIRAEKSGRNDILVSGKKFSGNAYYQHGDYCYHHGTLMVDVKKDDLGKYLTVSREKLKGKGVESVRSRVANLTEFLPELTIDRLKKALYDSFQETYALPAEVWQTDELENAAIQKLTEKYASWDWLYGRKLDFQYELSHHFSWGEVQIQLQVEKGKITDVQVYSDALKPELMEELPKYFKGIHCRRDAICAQLWLYWSPDPEETAMVQDITDWMKTTEI